MPDFVIDDYPEIVSVFGGYRIPDFYSKWVDDDDEMEEVYRTICEVAVHGRSGHRNWQPRHAEFERMLSGHYSGRPLGLRPRVAAPPGRGKGAPC